jgi:hypothetical protein
MFHKIFLFQPPKILWVQVEKFIFSFLPSPPFDKVREQKLAPYLSPVIDSENFKTISASFVLVAEVAQPGRAPG